METVYRRQEILFRIFIEELPDTVVKLVLGDRITDCLTFEIVLDIALSVLD